MSSHLFVSLDHSSDSELAIQTPVHWAARSGLLEVMSLLCKRGGNPNLYDGQGYNALHLAAHGAHYLMILYLVVCQSMDLDSLDSMGRTALMVSIFMPLNLFADVRPFTFGDGSG